MTKDHNRIAALRAKIAAVDEAGTKEVDEDRMRFAGVLAEKLNECGVSETVVHFLSRNIGKLYARYNLSQHADAEALNNKIVFTADWDRERRSGSLNTEDRQFLLNLFGQKN